MFLKWRVGWETVRSLQIQDTNDYWYYYTKIKYQKYKGQRPMSNLNYEASWRNLLRNCSITLSEWVLFGSFTQFSNPRWCLSCSHVLVITTPCLWILRVETMKPLSSNVGVVLFLGVVVEVNKGLQHHSACQEKSQ